MRPPRSPTRRRIVTAALPAVAVARARSAWRRACQRTALGALTPNRAAALAAGQPVRDGGQDTPSQIKGQRLRHAGRPPSPARTLSLTRPISERRPESVRAKNALARINLLDIPRSEPCRRTARLLQMHTRSKLPNHVLLMLPISHTRLLINRK